MSNLREDEKDRRSRKDIVKNGKYFESILANQVSF